MKVSLFWVACLGLILARAVGAPTVATAEYVWRDEARGREVPVKLYFPAGDAGGPFPVIVFSHGLGGSRDGYRYLGEYWAAHGYVSVHLQHHGSDAEVVKGQPPRRVAPLLKAAVADPANAINRPLDVRFVLDRLEQVARDPAFVLHDRLDLGRIGLAGHSFGAYTVLAVVGQSVAGGAGPARTFGPDPRVKAAIAMSSQRPRRGDLDAAYAPITIPIYHMTGTADASGRGAPQGRDLGLGNAVPADRRVAFDHTRNAPALLLTLAGGDHMVFAGRSQDKTVNNRELRRLILRASTAFWDAELKGDAAARRWLEDGGFAAELGERGTFERKAPSR